MMTNKVVAAALGVIAGVLIPGAELFGQQILTGRVQSTEGAVLGGASVFQLTSEDTALVAITDAAGNFHARLTGAPPWKLSVRHIGYQDGTLSVAQAGNESLVSLEARAIPVAGVQTSDSARTRVWVSNLGQIITDRGWFNRGRERECLLFVVDGVVLTSFESLRTIYGLYVSTNTNRMFVNPDPLEGSDDWVDGENKTTNRRILKELGPCIPSLLNRKRLPSPDFAEWPQFELSLEGTFRMAGEGNVLHAAASGDSTLALIVAEQDSWNLQVVPLNGGSASRSSLRPVSISAPTALAWRGDTILAADSVGDVVRRIVVRSAPMIVGADTVPGEVVGTGSGALFGGLPFPASSGWIGTRPVGPAPFDPVAAAAPPGFQVIHFDRAGDLKRVLAILRPGPERFVMEIGGSVMDMGPQPYRDHPLLAFDPEGRHLTVVDRRLERLVVSGTARITRISIEGDTIFQVDVPVAHHRLTDELVAEALEPIIQSPEVVAHIPDKTVRALFVRGHVYRPGFLPPVTAVTVDGQGRTWVRGPDHSSESVEWYVMSDDGSPLGRIALPGGARVIGSRMNTVWVVGPELLLSKFLLHGGPW